MTQWQHLSCRLCSETLTPDGRVSAVCAQKGRAHRLEILTVLAGLHHASDLHGGLTQVCQIRRSLQVLSVSGSCFETLWDGGNFRCLAPAGAS
jgi:hypothetical protein